MKFSSQLPKLPPSEMKKKIDNNNQGEKINEVENKTKKNNKEK